MDMHAPNVTRHTSYCTAHTGQTRLQNASAARAVGSAEEAAARGAKQGSALGAQGLCAAGAYACLYVCIRVLGLNIFLFGASVWKCR
jgi:hypothetical protein